MSTPDVTVVVPTHQRHGLLVEAVESALGQTHTALEVVVVDDASTPPVRLARESRLRVLHMATNTGGAAARNAGLAAARGRWVTFLDDDDALVPGAVEATLGALADATLPPPVGVLGAVEVVGPDGAVHATRFPPTLPKGRLFALEEPQIGRSFLTKQSLLVEAAVLSSIGGFDASLRSRVHSELFLRLNPVCSLLGIDTVTYRLRRDTTPRVSTDPVLRVESFDQLVARHRTLFESRPRAYARMLVAHAETCARLGRRRACARAVAQATRVHPPTGLRGAAHLAPRMWWR